MTRDDCQRCGEPLVEIPADPADWPEGVWIWTTYEGTWACYGAPFGDELHLHVPWVPDDEGDRLCADCREPLTFVNGAWQDNGSNPNACYGHRPGTD